MKTLIVLAMAALMAPAAHAQSNSEWHRQVMERYMLDQRLQTIEDQMFRDRLKRDYGSNIDGSYRRYIDQQVRDGRIASPYEAPRYDLYAPAGTKKWHLDD